MRHVPHLLVSGPWAGDHLALDSEQSHHLGRVLRMGQGDPLTYTDGRGVFGEGTFEGQVLGRGPERTVPRPSAVTVAVAPPRNRNRVRFLVEKLAEVGVERLVWVRTKHSEGRSPSPDKAAGWAAAALEQSRGAWLMEIARADLADLDPDRIVVAHPDGGEGPVVEAPILLIGPEGGLAPEETGPPERRLGLGPNILRVETAAIAGAVLLSNRQGGSVPG